MPALEVNASSSVCRKCGTAYGKLRGYFPVSYGSLYKGTGYLPYCKSCVDSMYGAYLAECNDPKLAVRQMCRKLDLYWNEKVYDTLEKQSPSKSIMTAYIVRTNSVKLAGKSYDDTLKEEGTLWSSVSGKASSAVGSPEYKEEDVPEDVVVFWGPGYTPSMYMELEQRRNYWMSKYPADTELDIGTEALIRQICSLEIDINKARAEGRAIDKYVNSLNTMLGSANLKPVQNTQSAESSNDNTPFGVWIKRWEEQRPIPEPDPEMQDVDGIVRYISIWFLGHLCKMLGIKNTYCKLYEDELNRIRIDRPEYEDEDDETMFNDIFSKSTEPDGDDV